MFQPDQLKTNEPLLWSPGRGVDIWNLFCAAEAGDVKGIASLLAKDASLARASYEYRTALAFAVRSDRLEAAEMLLSRGADPIHSGTSDTLAQMAGDRGFGEMRLLLERAIGGKNSSKPPLDGSPLAQAIRDRSIDRVREFLDAEPKLIEAIDERSNQPMHWAVMTRQQELIELLLSRGADIEAQRQDGARPLHLTNGDYHHRGWRDVPADWPTTPDDVYRLLVARGAYVDIGMAAAKGDIARVRTLLDEDPKLANRVADYVTYYLGSGAPLKNAASEGHIEIVELLLARGADPNLPEEGIAPRGHALYAAVAAGRYEIAKLLLAHGAEPNAPVESSADALSRAIMRDDKPMIELLCEHGAARSVEILAYYGDVPTAAAMFFANPDLANDPGALENAASEGKDAFVRLMLRFQPDLATRIAVGVRSKGPDGPIESTELAEYLFARGMNANLANWLGLRPLHRFAQRGDLASAALFIDRGAELDLRDDEMLSTPLGYAAKHGRLEMVELLLARGAKTNLPDDPAWATPLAWSVRRGHSAIALRLREAGASA